MVGVYPYVQRIGSLFEDEPENCEVFAGELRKITSKKKTLLFIISRF